MEPAVEILITASSSIRNQIYSENPFVFKKVRLCYLGTLVAWRVEEPSPGCFNDKLWTRNVEVVQNNVQRKMDRLIKSKFSTSEFLEKKGY
ncbi:hypothetical protein CEXT_503321 [Caerostris extrusa]|uniref:Uncharacterized protein n=1 Tax=Caerostris extrusa TaxID=172846 RepID=A0AAV4P224_CAEEX|nr:hypothetical protein CEXT_503321 [Caerostris extrusa]